MKLVVTQITPISNKWYQVTPADIFDAADFFQRTYFRSDFIIDGNNVYTCNLDNVRLI